MSMFSVVVVNPLTARLARGGSWGARAGLWTGLRNVTEGNFLCEAAATGCGGKMKVGFVKRLVGETLGLGSGERGLKSSSGVEGRGEMWVVLALELVGGVGGEFLMPLLGTIEGFGGRGG